MGLRTKFNLALLIVSTLGLGITGFLSHRMLQNNARDEVLQNAGIMMEAAQAVSNYTVTEVSPQLELQLQRVFLPQSVGSFAAIKTFNALRTKYPDYTYREVALNPTNPSHRATGWEAESIRTFRADANTTEVVNEL